MDSTAFFERSSVNHSQHEAKDRSFAKLTQHQRKRISDSLAAAFANISTPAPVEIKSQACYKDLLEYSPLECSMAVESSEPLNQVAEDLAKAWGIKADQVSRNSYKSLIVLVGNTNDLRESSNDNKGQTACPLSPLHADEESLGKRSVATLDSFDQRDYKLQTVEEQETDASVDGDQSTDSRTWRHALQSSVAAAFKSNLRMLKPHLHEEVLVASTYN